MSVSKTGWFLIRASNTSAYLSIRAEGADAAEVESVINQIIKVLKPFGLDLNTVEEASSYKN